MTKAKQVLPTDADLRTWSRALRSIPKAYGSDPSGIHPISLDGHLWVHVPLSEDQLRGIWTGTGVGTHHPESAWHRIGDFHHFLLDVAGYKLTSGVLKRRYSWIVIFGFILGDHTDPNMLQVASIGRTVVDSIPDAFDLIEAITMGRSPIPTSKNQHG